MKPLDELTAHCIRCGFCLESCPTFVETGEETESPRGRIYLVRSADEGKLDWEETRPHLNRCLGCRACETACPSGVEYGQIFEIARNRLESTKAHRTKRFLLKSLTSPARVKIQLGLGGLLPGKRIPAALSLLLSGEAPEANKPAAQKSGTWPAMAQSRIPPVKGEVYMLNGCVMQVLYPRVHEATVRLLRRIGYVPRASAGGCCGSLHLHAGYMDEAKRRARQLIDNLPESLPVVVNSAGCGSTMKGYADLFGGGREKKGESDPFNLAARSFASRVVDVSEFLLANGLVDELKTSKGLPTVATYHDACHLAHGQGVRAQPRELLQAVPHLKLVPMAEPDMCCGSAGIYNLTQPKMARKLLERKWSHVEATGAEIAVLGNPGCHAWIGQAAKEHGDRIKVLHTVELLEASFSGLPED